MTERELSELEEAVGSWTTKEQKRVLRELRKALGERAGWYADLVYIREYIVERTGR